MLREFSQVHWTEVVSGLLFVLLMSEALRFVVEGAVAASSGAPLQLNYWPRPALPSMEELPERLLALSLVALSVDFSQKAFLQLRGARAALAAGAGAAVRRYQACMALKLAAELGGLALIALRSAPSWGCALAFAGHVAFLLLNSLVVSPSGAVRETSMEARRGIASIDATLAALCVSAALVPAYALLPASLVTLFATVFLFDKFVRKTSH